MKKTIPKPIWLQINPSTPKISNKHNSTSTATRSKVSTKEKV
jgi:hypothetical protein